jgi:Amino acid permease
MARIETHGLRRSVGLGGLFATAYGNVGSSIYYALGLVAAYALGLTPVVFMLAGALFALTCKTYAEGASMFPEAGGSSSFARHAFNELVSFFAGWALSLDYILTIAISAFFVPHTRRRPSGRLAPPPHTCSRIGPAGWSSRPRPRTASATGRAAAGAPRRFAPRRSAHAVPAPPYDAGGAVADWYCAIWLSSAVGLVPPRTRRRGRR